MGTEDRALTLKERGDDARSTESGFEGSNTFDCGYSDHESVIVENSISAHALTRWEVAVLRAEIAVLANAVGQGSTARPPHRVQGRSEQQQVRVRFPQVKRKRLAKLKKRRMRRKRIEQQVCQNFAELRDQFLQVHGPSVQSALRTCFQTPVKLHKAPVASSVQDRFMDAYRTTGVYAPAFHGTAADRHQSIFANGLLIPGQGNKLTVLHGSAAGLGIYAAKLGGIWLSRSFCTQNRMLVCAVLPTHYQVTQHGDAYVAFNSSCIVPLFEAIAATPPQTSLSGPSFRRPSFSRASLVRRAGIEAYASRRAARRRRK